MLTCVSNIFQCHTNHFKLVEVSCKFSCEACSVVYSCILALSDRGIRISDITHVVCTHGNSDHVGNLNLFPDALLIVGYDISEGDTYYSDNNPLYTVYYMYILIICTVSFKKQTITN